MTLENGIQVMLRRSEVPPDVQAYLRHRADREVENLRKMMKQEGFVPDPGTLVAPSGPPATPTPPAAPATQPAAANAVKAKS